MKIYVGNIARESTEEEVKELFTNFGTVENFKLIRDINSNFIKGFGFVDMPNDDEAQKVIDELNGQLFKDRPLTVSLANPNSADKKSKKKPFDKGKGGFNKSGFNKTGGSGFNKSGGSGFNKGGSGGGTGGYKSGGGTGGYKSGGYKGGKTNEGNKSNGNREVNGNREGGNEGSSVNYFNKY